MVRQRGPGADWQYPLLINYLGLYILFLLVIPMGLWLLALEKRELVDRFGDAYRQYQREVPQLIPRLRRTR